MGFVRFGAVTLGVFALAGTAWADEAAEAPAPPAEGKPAEDDEPAKKKAPPAEEPDEDGVRFRGGISGGGGAMIFATDSSLGGSFTLGIGGLDGRLGVQINDLIGIYAQPQLGIYGGDIGVGGLAGGVLVVDFTFIDQIFVGVGGGGGILNNPAAGEVILRAGGYPAFGLGEDGIRRKGLMLGVDLRVFIAPTGSGTLIAPSPTFNIGYEAY